MLSPYSLVGWVRAHARNPTSSFTFPPLSGEKSKGGWFSDFHTFIRLCDVPLLSGFYARLRNPTYVLHGFTRLHSFFPFLIRNS